jgi:putative peptidoglycan lipid II flippase
MLIASYVSGAMSYLYYSQRIYWLPLTIIGIAMGSVLIPNLSASIRSINIQQALTVQKQAYKYCILTVLPATFCLVFLSDEIITVFFQRGEFSYESTIQTSLSLKLLLLGLPAATLVKILTPYFFAIEKPKIALKISVITNSINLALTISLFQLIGYIAIPLSLSISAWVNLLILLYTHKKLNFFHFDSEMISYSLKYLFLSGFLLIVLLIFDFFQFVTNNIYLDLLIETTVVLMLWICFIYFFDKEIRNIFILAGKKIGMKYFSD